MLMVNQCLAKGKMEPMVICNAVEIPSAQPHQRFVLEEYYCENPECDCEELYVSVVEIGEDDLPLGNPELARIKYSWASPETIGKPTLDKNTEQSAMADEFVVSYAKLCSAPEYNERVARHYNIVKEYGFMSESAEWDDEETHSGPVIRGVRIGRNQACPCGSGKKHKKCCMLKKQ